MEKIQSIQDAMHYLYHELIKIYPEHETSSLIEIVMNHVVKITKTELRINSNRELNAQQKKSIQTIARQLSSYVPIQQVLGKSEFYNTTLMINKQVMIPRQETEELVDWIISEESTGRQAILDIGTGSGCIAIALSKNLPASRVAALDYKQEILTLVSKNAAFNNVSLQLILEDITKQPLLPDSYDLIVSNPPYVRESEKRHMLPNVLDHEPHKALFVTDEDPLMYYRTILMVAQKHLHKNGRIYLEINENLAGETIRLLEQNGYKRIELKKDLNNKDRMIKACR